MRSQDAIQRIFDPLPSERDETDHTHGAPTRGKNFCLLAWVVSGETRRVWIRKNFSALRLRSRESQIPSARAQPSCSLRCHLAPGTVGRREAARADAGPNCAARPIFLRF
jgi:hypothetical protein